MSLLRHFTGTYARLSTKYPWKVTVVSTGVIACTGDLIAQQVVERKGLKNHDLRRSLKFFCMGAFFIGPTLRTWYMCLDKVVKGTGTTVALKKMLLDQGLFAPCFIACFFTVSGIADGKSFGQVKESLQALYIPAMKANYMLWPPVQMMNFFFVPLQHRVIVVNFVALFWNTYLAWAASAPQ